MTTTGGKIEVEPVGALVPLVGLIGANVELVALSLTVFVWPRASETENSNNPVKNQNGNPPSARTFRHDFFPFNR